MINYRTCIYTKKKLAKDQLLRIAITSPLQIDISQKIQSRGIYITNDHNIISELIQKGQKMKIRNVKTTELIELLESYINE